MDLTEIESHLNRVEERQEEVECVLDEVRRGVEPLVAYDMLDACEVGLGEISRVIEDVKDELMRGEGPMVNFYDEMTPMLIQLLKVGWKQEQLEDVHEALLRSYR